MPSLQTSKPTDSELLARFNQRQDEAAFASLMHRHWGFVLSVARTSLDNHSLAEDATQQTFIALSKRAQKISNGTPLGPWLYRAVRHEASNIRRREKRLKKRNQDYHAITQSDPDSKSHLSTKLHQALASLPNKDRELIILRYYQGLTADQIATRLKISPAAAQRRTHRALEQLSALANTKEKDPKSFSSALPVLLAPSCNPPSTALSKILSTSGKSTSFLVPAAGWLLATTLSVATVKKIVPPPPIQQVPISENSSSSRAVAQRKPRTTPNPPKPPSNPDVAHFITLARNSPAEALAWSREKFTSPRYLGEFLEKVGRYLSSHDLAFALEILTSAEGKTLRIAMIKEIFEEKFAQDHLSAIQWIESLSLESDHTAASRVTFSSSRRTPHLTEQLEAALSISTKKPVRLWIVRTLCGIYEKLDEPKILDLANTLEGEAQKTALNHLAQIQLDRDHPLATELISRLEGKIWIDERRVVQRAPSRYLDALLPWTPDPTGLPLVSAKIGHFLKIWLDYDPKAARQWFQKNKPGGDLFLSSETRKSLTQSDR